MELVVDLVKFRMVWWFKHLGRGSNDSVEALLRNINTLCVDKKTSKRKRIVDWIPPAQNSFKFNVDGSSRGNPGPAGMGGVLRDSKGKILCLFSEFLGSTDSNAAEIMAIRKAVVLCLSNPILLDHDISVVSDSKVAVSWANSKDFGNVDLVNIIYDIRSMLSERGNIRVVHDSRIFNSVADSLAKMGADNRGDFIDWCGC